MKALLYLGPAAVLGLLITAVPLVVAILFAVRPSASRLELMRPVTLAAIFASLAGICLSLANSFVGINRHSGGNVVAYAAEVFAESVIPAFVSFAMMAAAWLIIAMAMRRQT
jgi:hypothetical protein